MDMGTDDRRKDGYLNYQEGARIVYNLMRHLCDALNELSAQGLELRSEDGERWRWHWRDCGMRSARSFRSMGQALVDALATRYPEYFFPSLS